MTDDKKSLTVQGPVAFPPMWAPAAIKKTTPKKFVEERPGPGGLKLNYVSGGYMRAELERMVGAWWSFETELTTPWDAIAGLGQLVVKGRLTILDPNTRTPLLAREQFGGTDVKFLKGTKTPVDIGNDLKAAATDAFKKCVSSLGIAADVYDPKFQKKVAESGGHEAEPAAAKPKEAPSDVAHWLLALKSDDQGRVVTLQEREELMRVSKAAGLGKDALAEWLSKKWDVKTTQGLLVCQLALVLEMLSEKTK